MDTRREGVKVSSSSESSSSSRLSSITSRGAGALEAERASIRGRELEFTECDCFADVEFLFFCRTSACDFGFWTLSLFSFFLVDGTFPFNLAILGLSACGWSGEVVISKFILERRIDLSVSQDMRDMSEAESQRVLGWV